MVDRCTSSKLTCGPTINVQEIGEAHTSTLSTTINNPLSSLLFEISNHLFSCSSSLHPFSLGLKLFYGQVMASEGDNRFFKSTLLHGLSQVVPS